jgi:hypothetical protein
MGWRLWAVVAELGSFLGVEHILHKKAALDKVVDSAKGEVLAADSAAREEESSRRSGKELWVDHNAQSGS